MANLRISFTEFWEVSPLILEAQIKQGLFGVVRTHLQRILTNQSKQRQWKQLPDNDKAKSGEILRRVGLSATALRLLYKTLRGRGKINISPNIIYEYAASLTNEGLNQEALELLNDSQLPQTPQSLLFKAFALFAQWDYEKALPILKQLLMSVDPEDYLFVIAQVNRVAALVWCENFEEAQSELHPLMKLCEEQNYNLLLGNCYELNAQVSLRTAKFTQAESQLQQAEQLLKSTESYDSFFVEKWKTILELYKTTNKISDLHIRRMNDFIEKAKKFGHYETIRDCHLHLALASNKDVWKTRIYYGTPFEPYRKKIAKLLFTHDLNRFTSQSKKIHFFSEAELYQCKIEHVANNNKNHEYHQQRQPFNSTLSPSLDSPAIFEIQLELYNSTHAARIVQLLLSDFYRPWTITRLHQNLFPDRWYNPFSSPNLIHQSIHKARRYIESKGWPIKIRHQSHYFKIEITAPLFLLKDLNLKTEHALLNETTHLKNASDLRMDEFLSMIKRVFQQQLFSLDELLQQSHWTRRTAQRRLAQSLQKGHLIQIGHKYSLKNLYQWNSPHQK